ncbi:MAG: hypothetical protein AB1349_04585 [Elusimicrobiota bacterium]
MAKARVGRSFADVTDALDGLKDLGDEVEMVHLRVTKRQVKG